ncbi:hypothetical protein K439DRAFT_601635 [Ramaria rubella]|nr:hypothetical protein K439DRAFT_601635 [Ramaria rubella]
MLRYTYTSHITLECENCSLINGRREVLVNEYRKGVKRIYFMLTVTILVPTTRHIPFATIDISLEAKSRSSVSGYFCVPPARMPVGVRNICNCTNSLRHGTFVFSSNNCAGIWVVEYPISTY